MYVIICCKVDQCTHIVCNVTKPFYCVEFVKRSDWSLQHTIFSYFIKPMLDILFKSFDYHAPKNFKIICLSKFSTLRIPNECYSEDGSCAVNMISMVIFVLPLQCHSIRDMYIVIVYHVSSAWSIQWHRHNWVHQTQNKDKQNKKTQHIKLERGRQHGSYKNRAWTELLVNGNQFLLLFRHPPWRYDLSM